MKNIVILGSTGSIGKSALEIIDRMPEKFRVIGLSANEDIITLKKQALKYKPEYICITNETIAKKIGIVKNTKIFTGYEGLIKLCTLKQADIILIAVVGSIGLFPLLYAIKNRKKIALANKEALIIAGEIINKEKNKYNARIIPVDSEHSAIFQILQNKDINSVKRIILTASGGPFRNFSKTELNNITVKQALNHPTWKMGKKITIDSSTLMNKGLEVLEAHFLFNIPYEKIEVVIHPQSIVHSMVEFIDGAVFAQLSLPDMRLPIMYALTYPERENIIIKQLDITKTRHLEFQKLNLKKFPAFYLALKAGKIGGTMPACMNAANEIAVKNFLNGKIKFNEIPYYIKKTMDNHKTIFNPGISEIIQIDILTREYVQKLIDMDKN